MATTIYATFDTERNAERAAGALMDRGMNAADISFIIPEIKQSASVDTYDETGALLLDPIPMNSQVTSGTGRMGSVATLSSPIISEAPEHASRMPTLAGDTPIDVVEADHGPHIVDNNREQPRAARGISTTTARDAEKGAIEGAGFGLGLGLLLGLAVVAIPGVGLVAGAGALVAGLTAATGVAGAVAGGSYGFLHDMGIPPQYAQHLQDHLEAGGPLLSIAVTNDVPQSEIILLLEKYGATSMEAF